MKLLKYNCYPVHPFFIAIFPILSLYSHNIVDVGLLPVLYISFISLILTVFIFLISIVLLKNLLKAALMSTICIYVLLTFGHFYNIIDNYKVFGFVIGRYRFLLTFVFLILLIIFYFIKKSKKNFIDLTKILNILSLALVIIPLLEIGFYKYNSSIAESRKKSKLLIESNDYRNKNKPDIYYFIFDMYPGFKTLNDMFNYDNASFLNYLNQKGFYVALKSKSNYPITQYSISSSLNMEYINYINNKAGNAKEWRKIIDNMGADNKVIDFLKSHDYEIYNICSGWSFTDLNSYADHNLGYSIYNDFVTVFIEGTIFKPFLYLKLFSFHRNRIKRAFKIISELSRKKEKKFVFAHLICPHPPYIFTRSGDDVTSLKKNMTISKEKNTKNKFLDQLIYLNTLIEKLIDDILKNTNNNAVIVIQSDHGSDFSSDQKKIYQEKMNILNAYYFPGVNEEKYLYQTISPVNSFRLIFNIYFDRNIQLLQDKSYYITSESKYPYEYKDITSEACYNYNSEY